eukprot:augustus_masked-scaffold_25-processed-gene-4.17-mRNA-1 protein AED:1.00 eAED:1.00 QI:0/-1/0/0/-1/1/1/0/1101
MGHLAFCISTRLMINKDNLLTDVKSFCTSDVDGKIEPFNKIIILFSLNKEEINLSLLIKEYLGPYLTNGDSEIRASSVQLVAQLLERLPDIELHKSQAKSLLIFFIERYESDFESAASCLRGIQVLLMKKSVTFEDEDFLKVVNKVLQSHHVPQLTVSLRLSIYSVVDSIFENKVYTKALVDEGFFGSFIALWTVASEEEKDPRGLLVCMKINKIILHSLKPYLVASAETQEFEDSWSLKALDNVFNNCSVYFPVLFKPPKHDPYNISPKQVEDALYSVFASSEYLAPFIFPLVFGKFTEEYEEFDLGIASKVQAVKCLMHLVRNYDLAVLFDPDDNYFSDIQSIAVVQVIDSRSTTLVDESLSLIGLIAEKVASSVIKLGSRAKGPLSTFLRTQIVSYEHEILEKRANSKAKAFLKIMEAVTKSSSLAAIMCLEEFLPNSINRKNESKELSAIAHREEILLTSEALSIIIHSLNRASVSLDATSKEELVPRLLELMQLFSSWVYFVESIETLVVDSKLFKINTIAVKGFGSVLEILHSFEVFSLIEKSKSNWDSVRKVFQAVSEVPENFLSKLKDTNEMKLVGEHKQDILAFKQAFSSLYASLIHIEAIRKIVQSNVVPLLVQGVTSRDQNSREVPELNTSVTLFNLATLVSLGQHDALLFSTVFDTLLAQIRNPINRNVMNNPHLVIDTLAELCTVSPILNHTQLTANLVSEKIVEAELLQFIINLSIDSSYSVVEVESLYSLFQSCLAIFQEEQQRSLLLELSLEKSCSLTLRSLLLGYLGANVLCEAKAIALFDSVLEDVRIALNQAPATEINIAVRAIASTVNKAQGSRFDVVMDKLKKIDLSLDIETLTENKILAAECVFKAEAMRGSFEFLNILLPVFKASNIQKLDLQIVVKLCKVIRFVYTDSNLLLNEEAGCQTTFLFKQRFLQIALKALSEDYNDVIKLARYYLLGALSQKDATKVFEKSLSFQDMLKSMESEGLLSSTIVEEAVMLTETYLQAYFDRSTTVKDQVKQNLTRLINAVIHGGLGSVRAEVKLSSLEILAFLILRVEYTKIHPHRRRIVNGLKLVLDDPDKNVRKQAVEYRNLYITLDGSVN